MALVHRSDGAQVYENVLEKNEGQSLNFTFTYFEKPNNVDPTSTFGFKNPTLKSQRTESAPKFTVDPRYTEFLKCNNLFNLSPKSEIRALFEAVKTSY